MKYLSTKQIENIADTILESARISSVPVNLERIANILDVKVAFISFEDEISGLIVMENGKGNIGINSNHPKNRQRFTLAHELGHFVLHSESSALYIDKAYNAYFRDKKSSKGEARAEIQANQFAAAILMPRKMLAKEAMQDEIDIADDLVLDQVAERYSVSRQALIYRLSNLGFFED